MCVSTLPKEVKGGRTIKKLTVSLIVMAMIGMSLVALAADMAAESGHYSWGELHWIQDYCGWGPACYYGEDVRIVYDATNVWTYVVKRGLVEPLTGRIRIHLEDSWCVQFAIQESKRQLELCMDRRQGHQRRADRLTC